MKFYCVLNLPDDQVPPDVDQVRFVQAVERQLRKECPKWMKKVECWGTSESWEAAIERYRAELTAAMNEPPTLENP